MRVFSLVLVMVLACATPPAPKPAALDPSNPEAPEAPLPEASAALDVEAFDAGAPEAPAMHPSHHHHGGSP